MFSLTRPAILASTKRAFATTPAALPRGEQSIIPLSNVEAQWATLSTEEQAIVHRQLAELQKHDWKSLSRDEKKAAYYVSFGPHGPREPVSKEGDGLKVVLGVVGLLGISGLVFAGIRSMGGPPPKTMTREWQEASNEKGREQKENPFTGVTSEGYDGKGHIQSK